MICEPCKDGARSMLNGLPPEAVAADHDGCPGGTWCDCQHGTQSALNQKLVTAADVGVGAAEE